MIPLRLVIDTNVVVSAALKPEAKQRTVVLLAMTKPARWYVSNAVVSEYQLVLARSELKIRRGLRLQLLQLIANQTRAVTPSRLEGKSPPQIRLTTCSWNAATPREQTT